jgi:hypothetical protein
MLSAASAVETVTGRVARTKAKSRTQRSRLLAMRGVPRERLAISNAPARGGHEELEAFAHLILPGEFAERRRAQ